MWLFPDVLRFLFSFSFFFIFPRIILWAITRVKPCICTMPLKMEEGWNQIQLNLADFTRRPYGTNYVETLGVQIHANWEKVN
ncbi:hypothetical protein MANES_04G156350v8 [Manihot esculenta]|uniref:Uncharacterized protein n=1 Tax=Manihot esculenta TaxID=3983 RepID=A0ACB7HVF2_MANES|nr:hypothetical protein MANES_04G156350v8 [Manihot esculenta]